MTDATAKNEEPIRICIVDDDPFIRASLITILGVEGDIDICGEAENGIQAISLYSTVKPDILLMDIQMPQCSGLEAAMKILDADNNARIVFLTTFSDDEYIVTALRMGAKGYLVKQEVSNIAPSIRAVIAGQMVLAGEVIGKVDALMGGAVAPADKVSQGKELLQKTSLSERECDIVELIAQGLDNKEIAGTLFISEGTTRNHISAILQKLNLKNRTQIAVYYYKNSQ